MSDEARRFLAAHFPELDWPAAPWARLGPLLRVQRAATGAVVVAQGRIGSPLMGLLSGALDMRFLAADGGVSVIEHVLPGQLFGLAAFVTGRPSTYEALAARPSRLLRFSPGAYTLLMDEVPGFARALMAEFAQRHDGTLRWLAATRHQGAMERLTLALDQLRREQSPAPRDAHGAIGLHTTQAALAELAGLSRQTVNQLLSQLQAQGRLRRDYGRLWLSGG